MTSRDEVMAAFGEAMLAIQQLEEAMVGLIGATRELEAASRDDELDYLNDPWPLWERLFKKTGGSLIKDLGFDGSSVSDVERAITARNLLAHHYLRDHACEFASEAGRGVMLARLRDATDRFLELRRVVGIERSARMEAAGFTDDHITSSDEARRMRYYDPSVDDAVPPEPFDK